VGYAFFINIEFEKVPLFCSHCQYELSHFSKKVGVALKDKKYSGKSIHIAGANEKNAYTHLLEKDSFHEENNTFLGEANNFVDADLTNQDISSVVVTTTVAVVTLKEDEILNNVVLEETNVISDCDESLHPKSPTMEG